MNYWQPWKIYSNPPVPSTQFSAAALAKEGWVDSDE